MLVPDVCHYSPQKKATSILNAYVNKPTNANNQTHALGNKALFRRHR